MIQVFDKSTLHFVPKWEPHYSFSLDRQARNSSICSTDAQVWTKIRTSVFFFTWPQCALFKYLTKQSCFFDQNENLTILFHWTATRLIQVFDQQAFNFGPKWEPRSSFFFLWLPTNDRLFILSDQIVVLRVSANESCFLFKTPFFPLWQKNDFFDWWEKEERITLSWPVTCFFRFHANHVLLFQGKVFWMLGSYFKRMACSVRDKSLCSYFWLTENLMTAKLTNLKWGKISVRRSTFLVGFVSGTLNKPISLIYIDNS